MLPKPQWPDPWGGHLRGIGAVKRRVLQGFDSWVGEGSLVCGLPAMAIDLPRWLAGTGGARVSLVRKACYFDGLANGRFEFMFRVAQDPDSFDGVSHLTKALLARPVTVPKVDRGRPPRPLARQSAAVAWLWAHATVRRGADPYLRHVRAGRAFVVVESSVGLGPVAQHAPAGVRLSIERTEKPFELFVIYPPTADARHYRSSYRACSRTLRTYLLRMLQDVESISQLCGMASTIIDHDSVQYVLNEYTRHIIRSRQKVESTTDLVAYCYAAFARLYPGRVEGLRRTIAASRIRPTVKSKVLEFLDRVEGAQVIIVEGDQVMGDKYQDITATGQGIAIGRDASATVSNSVNQSIDPQVIEGLRALAGKVRESKHDDAEIEAQCIEIAATKAEAGDEKGAIAYLRKTGSWAIGLASTVGSTVLGAYLKSHLGLP